MTTASSPSRASRSPRSSTTDGEPHFRALEREALEALAAGARLRGRLRRRHRDRRRDGRAAAGARHGRLPAYDDGRDARADSRPFVASAARRSPKTPSGSCSERTALYTEFADIEVDTVGQTPVFLAEHIAGLIRKRRPLDETCRRQGQRDQRGLRGVIGPELLEDVGELVRLVAPGARKVAIITDNNVGDLFGLTVERKLIEAGFDVHPLSVAAGEASKSWAVAGEVLEALAELRLDRDDLVLALGGGVIGDLAGFVAATYLRGISFVQVPTTLLAQVDSSVGGKTGVDLRAGKNLAGAFKQPLLVIADTSTLSLLPEPEWASGLAEIAKSAVVDGEEFLGWLEENAAALVARDEAAVNEAVKRSVGFKSRVVTADETEAGPRECLNYGHTFGHALEKVSGYGVHFPRGCRR